MKRVNKSIIAVLLVLAVLIANKKTTTSKTTTDYYITTTNLNVRAGAGKQYAVSFTLKKGDEVEILSKKKNWYQIRYLEKKGYAHSKYLKYSRTVSDITSYAPSHSFPQTLSYIAIGILAGIALAIGIIIFRKIRDKKLLKTVTGSNRGTRSERNLVLKLLKYGIPAQTIFHDLYIKKDDGGFSQIDLVVIAEVGILVFEVKDYSGWIFGSGNQSQWTKVSAYGRQTYQFYNPIMQNNRHIEELRKKLKYPDNVPFYSIVLFYGDCVLRDISFIPKGTFLTKSNRALAVMEAITTNNDLVQYGDKDEIFWVLKEAVENGESAETRNKHTENIRNMLKQRQDI